MPVRLCLNMTAWNYCFRLQNVVSLTDQDYNASMCLLRGSWGVYDVVVHCIFLDEIREIVLRFMVRLRECCDCEIGIGEFLIEKNHLKGCGRGGSTHPTTIPQDNLKTCHPKSGGFGIGRTQLCQKRPFGSRMGVVY